MDLMGCYVPNTSRRVLGILFFFLGWKPLPRSCREFFFPRFSVFLNSFDLFWFFCLGGGHFLFLGIKLCAQERGIAGFSAQEQGTTGFSTQERGIAGFSSPGAGNHWVFQVHRVFHPGAGNHRVFRPGAPGFPPRCTGFSTPENGKSLWGEGRVGGN